MKAKLKATSSLKSNAKLKIILFLILFAMILGLLANALISKDGLELVVQNQRTKEEYVRMEVLMGDQIELSWIHSVEKTPWVEKLEVSEGEQLKLVETKFKSFGAGVPHDTANGEVYVKGGFTVMTGLNRMFSTYRWIHSQQARFSISLNGHLVISPEDIPHHQAVEMYLDKR